MQQSDNYAATVIVTVVITLSDIHRKKDYTIEDLKWKWKWCKVWMFEILYYIMTWFYIYKYINK